MARINLDFYRTESQSTEFTEIDRVIYGYILSADEENCDSVIEYDGRVEVFMQLSSLRKSTISWYPFKENAFVLEVGGGFGALTGALCDKAEHVVVTEPSFFRAKALIKRYQNRKNLEVYVGEIQDIDFAEKFDYIILCGVLEEAGRGSKDNSAYIQYLRSLVKYLKKDGKVLIAVDNLYSITRWNDRNVLENANQIYGKAIKYFHQKQLREIADGAGLSYQKFYYPMPDYRVVGCVYTDEYLPTAEEWQQLGGYDLNRLIPLPESIYNLKNLIDNGAFPFWSNSFLVEAGKTEIHGKLQSTMVLSRREDELHATTKEEVQFGNRKLMSLDQLKLKPRVHEVDQDRMQLEKVMQVQLDLLKKLKQVCDKYHLKLFAMYGTMLGAVRHGGIIPGDDDIDVALSREDYNKLVKLTDEFEGKYFLQTPWNDNCFYGGYLKLRNRETTAVHPQNWWVDCCEGIGIDIFPLDNGYLEEKKESWKETRIRILQRLLYAKAYSYFPRFKDMSLLKWKAYKYLGLPFSRGQLSDMLNSVMAEGDDEKGSPFGIFAHYGQQKGYRALDRELFKETINMAYEDLMLAVPRERDKVLEMLYGLDYMTPLPWQEGRQRHGFYRADASYQVYKNRFSGLMKPTPIDKDIVLFGDGLLFEKYFGRYGDKFMPRNIVLMAPERLVESVHGIKVESFADFAPNDKDKIYPVICSVDIAKAEEIMKQAGYQEYYFFVENRDWLLLANSSCILREVRRNE